MKILHQNNEKYDNIQKYSTKMIKKAQKTRKVPPQSEKNRQTQQKFFYTVKNNAIIIPSSSSNSNKNNSRYRRKSEDWFPTSIHPPLHEPLNQKRFLSSERVPTEEEEDLKTWRCPIFSSTHRSPFQYHLQTADTSTPAQS